MPLVFALAIITFAAVFHIHWAFGGRLGFSVSLPQRPDGVPVMAHRLPWWRPAAGGVTLFLIGLALLLLGEAGHLQLPVPRELMRFTLVCVGAAFICRAWFPNTYVGFLKTLRTTRWAKYDTWLYSPLFLVLGLLIVWQATH
jgi:hypothetical protein